MSCRSYKCEGEKTETKESFNAGTPPYLGYSGYPGSEFPSQCGGGYGYGGQGHYGTYEGCAPQEDYNFENPAFTDYDNYNAVHQPGCACMKCQVPYSMPYQASPKACQNPWCKCGDCQGDCKCGAQEVAHQVMAEAGHDASKLIDFGLTNGSGLKGHLSIPFVNLHVDFNALLRYATMILIVAVIAYYFLGLRMRR